MVGYPCGDTVSLPFHVSALALQRYELEKPVPARLLTEFAFAWSGLVSENRRALTEHFLATDADWLLQIDTDISFPPDLIETLLAIADEGRWVIGARIPGSGAWPARANHLARSATRVLPPEYAPLQPVEALVSGAVLFVHRRVFEAIAARAGQCWFQHTYARSGGNFEGRKYPYRPEAEFTPLEDLRYTVHGEDVAFAIRARDAGFATWSVYIPGLKHYVLRPLTFDDGPNAREPAGSNAREPEACAE